MSLGVGSGRGLLARRHWVKAGVLCLVLALATGARGQAPSCPAADTCVKPLAAVPEKGPRPAEGPGSVSAFIEGLSSNDAALEVLVGQGRILNLRESLMEGKSAPLIATGDPTVIDFIVVNPRQIRVVGSRIGVTDLSVTTSDGKAYSFEVRVVFDLDALRARLRCLFPDASLKLSQFRDQVVVVGQARDTAQVERIMIAVRSYVRSVSIGELARITAVPSRFLPPAPAPGRGGNAQQGTSPIAVSPELSPLGTVRKTIPPIQVLNLIRVPTSQQVLLKVRVAELNRTALRQVGADILTGDPGNGAVVGTQIGGASVAGAARWRSTRR